MQNERGKFRQELAALQIKVNGKGKIEENFGLVRDGTK
jgi:hypothetical protein